MLLAIGWVLLALYLARPWIGDLQDTLGSALAIFVIGGLALLPGYFAAFLFWSVLLDRRDPLRVPAAWPPLHVLIAAWGEEEGIVRTLRALSRAHYPGRLRVTVVDDGSRDSTAERAEEAAKVSRMDIRVIRAPHRGKAAALNRGLEEASEEYIMVLDADTEVLPGAPQRLVQRMLQSSASVGAVAGSLLLRGSGWMVALQSWDYVLGIAATKRSQSTMGATLVAQGAFSLYRRSFLLGVDPWIDSCGEDIVLSWQILEEGEIQFEPTAFARTHPPHTLQAFWRQRVRWARGMIEGLRSSGLPLLRRGAGQRHGVGVDFLFPWVDAAYTFAFLPGVVLLLMGYPLVVGLWTVLLLPLQIVIFSMLGWKQKRALREAGVEHKPRRLAFWGYLLFYQALLSPAALWGYVREILRHEKRW